MDKCHNNTLLFSSVLKTEMNIFKFGFEQVSLHKHTIRIYLSMGDALPEMSWIETPIQCLPQGVERLFVSFYFIYNHRQ